MSALLLFSDEPRLGVDRIRQLPDHILKSYEARDLVRFLGLCQAKEAAEFLAALADNYEVIRFCPYEYVSALVECKQKVAWQALLRLLDNLEGGRIVDREIRGTLVFELGKTLGQIAKQADEIWLEIRSRCEKEAHGETWNVLFAALQEVNTEEALLTACRLPRDHAGLPMWDEPPYGFEDLFIDKVPAGSQGAYYRRPKPLARLRKILIAQALHDAVRKKSSLVLLIFIELLRLEVGWPMGEPRHPDATLLNGTSVPWPLAE